MCPTATASSPTTTVLHTAALVVVAPTKSFSCAQSGSYGWALAFCWSDAGLHLAICTPLEASVGIIDAIQPTWFESTAVNTCDKNMSDPTRLHRPSKRTIDRETLWATVSRAALKVFMSSHAGVRSLGAVNNALSVCSTDITAFDNCASCCSTGPPVLLLLLLLVLLVE